jgi:soluble lytic murein transglycosylase-like protein
MVDTVVLNSMVKPMKLILALLVTGKILAAEFNQSEFDKFVGAIAKVESNNNPDAIGDSGLAKGLLQIHLPCLQDSNEYGKTNFNSNDRLNPAKSKIICLNYLKRYAKVHKWEAEKMARLWNGGVGGVKNPKRTDNYWKKVKSNLK